MKKGLFNISLSICMLMAAGECFGQGMHFSQYYNAPLLQNPANAALMRDNDYRVGINYRNQWASLPVPYKTFSAFGDFQLMRNRNKTNWMGIGLAIFNDVAGDGDLTVTRMEGTIAYHVQTSETSLISVGLSGAYSQRSLNFNKLTFGLQWDGFKFDPSRLNGEKDGTYKTTYFDVGAGVNYSFYPNEFFLLKVGAGVAHINQPTETFYNNLTNSQDVANRLNMRPTGNAEAIIRTTEKFTLAPSVYYTYQDKASQLIAGSLGMFYLSGEDNSVAQLIVGGFYRLDEAIIGVAGVQWAGMKVMASYDFTTSGLAVNNKGNGAFEISAIFQGLYGELSGSRETLNCPRF